MIISLYEALEISQMANGEEIRLSYRKLAMKWHPDRNQDNLEKAETRFKQIAYAYAILSDPDKRQQYDATLASEQAEKQFNSRFNQPVWAKEEPIHNRVNVDFDLAAAVENFVDAMFQLSRSLANSKHGKHTQTVLFEMLIGYGCPTDMSAKLTAFLTEDQKFLQSMKKPELGAELRQRAGIVRVGFRRHLVLAVVLMIIAVGAIFSIVTFL